MLEAQSPGFDVSIQFHSQARRSSYERANRFLKDEGGRRFSALGGCCQPAESDRSFPASGRADQQCARTPAQSPTGKGVQFGDTAAGRPSILLGSLVFGGHEPGKDDHSTVSNAIVMESLAKGAASQFCDFQPSHGSAILATDPVQRNHAMHDAVQFQVCITAAAIV